MLKFEVSAPFSVKNELLFLLTLRIKTYKLKNRSFLITHYL